MNTSLTTEENITKKKKEREKKIMVRNNIIISMSTVIRERCVDLVITYVQLPQDKRMVHGAINKLMTTNGADSMN